MTNYNKSSSLPQPKQSFFFSDQESKEEAQGRRRIVIPNQQLSATLLPKRKYTKRSSLNTKETDSEDECHQSSSDNSDNSSENTNNINNNGNININNNNNSIIGLNKIIGSTDCFKSIEIIGSGKSFGGIGSGFIGLNGIDSFSALSNDNSSTSGSGESVGLVPQQQQQQQQQHQQQQQQTQQRKYRDIRAPVIGKNQDFQSFNDNYSWNLAKYLLSDCTEAVVKLKGLSKTISKIDLPSEQDHQAL
ncbi:hypothetical protein ACTFIZ_004367 [Dictyostelium cf. discoideum]